MHDIVAINGEVIAASDARLSAVSSAALFGRGIFTTIAIHNGKPFLWDKHWRRLTTDAEKLGIAIAGFQPDTLYGDVFELIKRNAVDDGRVRISLFDGSPSRAWPFASNTGTTSLVMTGELRKTPELFLLTTSPYCVNSRSPLAGIKSCNYLENLVAMEEAHSRGHHEAIRINERAEVAGGTMANVFWLSNGKLFTPALRTGCLPGTTREFILERFDCREVEAGLEELRAVDAIFLTSAGLGAVQVMRFEEIEFAAARHPILDAFYGS